METELLAYATCLTTGLALLRFVIHELVDMWRWIKRL